ncbi:MAG: ATP synthase F1 subunit gamma [Ardenticatenaceae bacterium]|nr:ATP synthase F1 subunit gamma [Ardenticatenaceae bacterium]HBY97648.1 ATP synthase F1 subunit gamma [Chloroflexota bacterium]
MATAREIKRRIRSVKNIGQVTRAMEAVSASKMRRAQERTLASRSYAERARDVLSYLAAQPSGGETHPLLTAREPQGVGLILITPDRGLAGALVSNVLRRANRFIQEQDELKVGLITVGRRGRDFMLRYGPPLYAEFPAPPDTPPLVEVSPIARTAIEAFLIAELDQVWIAYTEFINTMMQRPVVRQLLPIQPPADIPRLPADFLIEPNPQAVLDELLPAFVEMQVYQAVLEAQASEHSARMVAMRNATENAKELVEDLTLTYNKARQEAITKEILDIAGGAEALAKATAE